MTMIEARTVLQELDADNRLLNAVLKGATTKPGRQGFRGDIALKFQQQLADEKRPPEYSLEQVFTIAEDAAPGLPFLAGYLHNFAWLKDLAVVLEGKLVPDGKYFIFCNNIDLLAKFNVSIDGISFIVLPCDESTVWVEMLELLGIDRNDVKKLSTAGKLDHLADKALAFSARFAPLSYEAGLAGMEPVKNRNANRPV